MHYGMSTVSFLQSAADVESSSVGGETSICSSCGGALIEEGDRRVDCGYTNPLSLDTLLVRHPSATYFVRVGLHEEEVISENTYLGVRTGDILMVDRACTPDVGSLVLAACAGELTLCRYTEHEGRRFLVCGARDALPVELVPECGIDVWGVVAALSRRL